MVFVAALSRIVPHPPNFAPIGGMALFGAAHFTKKYWAFLIPLIAFWVSDLILNNVFYAAYYDSFQWFGSTWVYISLILIVLLGFTLHKKVSAKNVVIASLSASAIFFFVTNIGAVWSPFSVYPKDLTGVIASLTAGIPFVWGTIAGDLFYSAVLFGAFELVNRKYFKVELSSANIS